ncbi:MAG TPA: SGNH/GDSL hydrolase family protein [Planctomycetota bacterium]|nr:SGNH/GDSL hydrolase family protein [Planctomycetota bacterium]
MTPPRIGRRRFLASTAAGAASLLLPRPCRAAQDALLWHDAKSWGVEGRGWADTARPYDRFPSKAEKTVPGPVWNLSRHSAGMLVRFETDSPSIHARWSLLHASLALPHMPATGVSGLDLYARDEQGRDRWLAVAKPTQQTMELKLAGPVDPLPGGRRRLYTVYLPLYNGTESLEIGVDATASFQPVAPRAEKPVVFYGTSILHGAYASRPGMAFPAILGRRFNRPTVNLGFSGNGRMEPEVVALLSELDPCLYAIDCLPNMTPEQVAERAGPLVRQLRKARPDAPILLVEDRSVTSAPFLNGSREGHAARRAALRKAYAGLLADGIRGLGYLEGEGLLGDDGEAATDGSHPSDLGMQRYADAYEREMKKLL